MKKYIILTSGLFSVGGAEMYNNNKVKFLQKKGWIIEIYFFNKGSKIYYPYLDSFGNNLIQELRHSINLFTQKDLDKIINPIVSDNHVYDLIIVESQLLNLSLWGEYISKKINACHIMNPLEEKFLPITKELKDFYLFKLDRNEILTVNSIAFLKRLFQDDYKTEYESYIHDNFGDVLCANVTEDIDFNLEKFKKADFNIISIGRLNKPYILNTFIELKKYIKNDILSNYNILIIGESNNNKIESKIKDLFFKVDNVTIYFLGSLFPIPRKVIRFADVGIASANSVDVIYNEGVPVINIDTQDQLPIGIYKVTTTNKFMRGSSDNIKELSFWLNKALKKKEFIKKEKNISDDIESNINTTLLKQYNFINNRNFYHNYYEVYNIYENRFIKKFEYYLKRIFYKTSNLIKFSPHIFFS